VLICRNTEGVHAQRKVGNPCTSLCVFAPQLATAYIGMQ